MPGAHPRFKKIDSAATDFVQYVKAFDTIATSKTQTLPLSILKDTALGIEAGYYLTRLLTTPPTKEPLLTALGGFPYGLRENIENDIHGLQQAGIKPLFIFSGIRIARDEQPFSKPDIGPQLRLKAWDMYDKGLPQQAVDAFGDAGTLDPPELYRSVIKILRENDVEFMVAPYSAWAQLAYLYQHPKGFVDAVYGSSELLLFDVEKVITSFSVTRGNFSWVTKDYVLKDLSISHDQFIDACLIAGCDICSTYPPLENNPNAFKAALEIIQRYRSAPNALAAPLDNHKPNPHSAHLNKFYRAKAAIKHHVILTDDGRVEPLNAADAPGDVHEFIGQRFPEELYFYLSRGVIGPQVLDQLAFGEMIELAPLDMNDSDEYKRFLDNLATLRTQALSLVAQRLNRYFHNKHVQVYYWFDPKNPRKLTHKDLNSTLNELTGSWNVKEASFKEPLEKRKTGVNLINAVSLLENAEFAASTIQKKKEDELLKAQDELIINTLWRLLQIREFVKSDHTLSTWGKALNAALSVLKPQDNLEEAVVIGMELLRLKVLKADNFMFQLPGAPQRGSEEDRRHAMLISRVALLAPIRHKAIGYTGPLSRNLLGFNSFIKQMTRGLRNLVEMVLASMLLNGDADREDRNDWPDLSLRLPFIDEANAGLGIAVKTYLDELANEADPTSWEARITQKTKLPSMFAQAIDIVADLEIAFRLWDAMVVGIKAAQGESLIPDAQKFLDANNWLSSRR